MSFFTFKNFFPKWSEGEVKNVDGDFPSSPVSPGPKPPDAAKTPPPVPVPSFKLVEDTGGVYNRWTGKKDSSNRAKRKTSTQSLRNERPEKEDGHRPMTAMSGAPSQTTFHKSSEDVLLMPLPLKVRGKGGSTNNHPRPSSTAVSSRNLLPLPSGLSPRERRSKEKRGDLEELAAVARMLSGESSSAIKRTTLEISGASAGGGLGSGGSGSGSERSRLSPGVRMPGSPGFTDDELREWELKGLNMLE